MQIVKITKTARRLIPVKYCGAVIVAAGYANRMEGIDKVMADIGGTPMIVRTVENFQQCDAIREIVIVTREDLLVDVMSLCHPFNKVRAVVVGGSSRMASVNIGLDALSSKVKLAAIHDGARPFASWRLIDRVVRAGGAFGAAAPAVPVKDTVKLVRGGLVKSTPDRDRLRAVQTPQVFDYDLLRAALTEAKRNEWKITDDASAVELMGMEVRIVPGDERNIKITTPSDMQFAQLIAREEV